MLSFFDKLELGIWIAWIVTWNLAAIWRARATVEAPRSSYRLHFFMIALGIVLVFNGYPVTSRPVLWQAGPVLGWGLIAVTLAGIAFAWWARFALGKLWSGGIEVKDGHRVVDTGPYALARHPIYTGLIVAVIAAALLRATPWAFAGALLFSLGFVLKARIEERFLEKEIGGYVDYRRRVPMIVPFAGWH